MRTSALEKKATSKSYKLYVAIMVTLNILPHCFDLPAWLIIIAAIFIIWSILNIYRNFKLPSVLFRNILVAISAGFIYMNYKTFFGPDPAAALFVVVAAVKLVDFTKYRDGMIEIILCYFLLLTHLLHSQSLGTTLFFTVDVFIITTLMHQLHKNDRRQSMRTFLPSLKMLFLAMPIWIFLFLVFPRFSASLMHAKPSQSATGFSANLTPGSISQLLQSDETAFHVKFDHSVRNDDMYFRGAILSESEGLTWKKSFSDDKTDLKNFEQKKGHSQNFRLTRQEIVIEPSFQRALFTLDFPVVVSSSESARITKKEGEIYEFKEARQSRTLYTVESSNSNIENLRAEDRVQYLQVPKVSQKVLDLAQVLSKNTTTTQQKISKILTYFSSQKFYYTLEPGQMPGDGMTTFLFDKKGGFCEHYAATLSTLARLMGIPSRVVVGFQGGKFNEITDYFVVKTADAHAWSEVWSDEENTWVRVDPTVVVAPIRIRYGAEAYREGLTQSSLLEAQNSMSAQISTNIFFAIDTVTTKWNNFLLKYDFAYQNKLLEGLGFAKSSRLTLFILLFAGLAALTAALKIYFSSQKAKVDPILSLYHLFCRKLEAIGVTRSRTEGPEHLMSRAIKKLPERQQAIESILKKFIEIRYLGQKSPSEMKSLRQSIRKF